MKKIAALFLAVCLLSASSVAFAVPKNVQYNNTIRFLQAMDDHDLSYNYQGLDSDNDEHVTIGYEGKITVHFFFTEDNDECNIRVWDVVQLKSSNVQKAYQICSQLNYRYKWCAFYVDDTDNTVTISMDLILRDNDDAGEICLEALVHIIMIYNEGYEVLKDL